MIASICAMLVSPHNTELVQIVTAFAGGLVFGPYSLGIEWFAAYCIAYEVMLIYATRMVSPWWKLTTRVVVNCASLLGWVIGRWLICGKTGFEAYITAKDE